MTDAVATIGTQAPRNQALLRLQVFTSPTRAIRGPGERTFSPVTSTLVCGETQAVLVDSQYATEDVDALGDMIATSGKTLTTIFITHGHSDHYFGSARLAERFPGVKVVATPGVVDYIAGHLAADTQMMSAMFGDALAAPTLLPSSLTGHTVALEGHDLQVIEVGQGDIAPSTVLHMPELGAVVVGDVAYNRIHQMLGLGGPAEWEAWIASIDAIARLNPRTVVVGHKRPDASDEDVSDILDGTSAYIRDFAQAVASADSVEPLIATMRTKYPDHGNLTTLVYSANAAIRTKSQ